MQSVVVVDMHRNSVGIAQACTQCISHMYIKNMCTRPHWRTPLLRYFIFLEAELLYGLNDCLASEAVLQWTHTVLLRANIQEGKGILDL